MNEQLRLVDGDVCCPTDRRHAQPANSAGSSSRLAPAPVASPNVFVHPNVANVGTTQTPTWPNVETHTLGVRMVALVKTHLEEKPASGLPIGGRLLPAP